MKLPAYYTQFLACCEGHHQNCQHIDAEGNVIWVCGCSCHPHVLLNHADLGTELVSGAAKNDFQIVAASA
jgi:hypothetical protein